MTLGMVWNLVSPETFDTGRTNRPVGFGGNPNTMAVSFLFVLVGAIDWQRNLWTNLMALALSGFSIYLTLSVGGLAMYAVVFCAYLMIVIMKRQSSVKKIMVLIAVGLMFALTIPVIKRIIDSYDIFSTYSMNKRLENIAELMSGDFSFVFEHSRTELVDSSDGHGECGPWIVPS